MNRFILQYNYIGEKEKFLEESNSEEYLKHKIMEISLLSEKDIEYTIYEVKDKGIIKNNDID